LARPQGLDQTSGPPPPPGAPGAQTAGSANGNKGGYTIQANVNLVVLHASVLDDRGVFVPGLKQDDFRVYEDKVQQTLSVFKQEDVPVSV